jgi:hypothetical protein
MKTRSRARRLLITAALPMLAACAGAEPRIVSQTPASVEIDCMTLWDTGCRSAQAVADLAQRHCRQYGLDAQESKLAESPSGNRRVIYNCVDTRGSPATPAAPRSAPTPR